MYLYKMSLFQFCETSSAKFTVWSLVMLLTMEDSRSRLEDADDSLLAGSKKDRKGEKIMLLTRHLPVGKRQAGLSHNAPSLWFIMAAVECSGHASVAFFQWQSSCVAPWTHTHTRTQIIAYPKHVLLGLSCKEPV